MGSTNRRTAGDIDAFWRDEELGVLAPTGYPGEWESETDVVVVLVVVVSRLLSGKIESSNARARDDAKSCTATSKLQSSRRCATSAQQQLISEGQDLVKDDTHSTTTTRDLP